MDDNNNNNIDNNLTNNIANDNKILIAAKIKLRGEEIGGAFRSIIYDKLKKKKIMIKKIIILGI